MRIFEGMTSSHAGTSRSPASARATTNGVSAHVDALGRIALEGPLVDLARAERETPTLLRAQVPLFSVQSVGPAVIPRFPLACTSLLGFAYVVGRSRMQRRRRSFRQGARR